MAGSVRLVARSALRPMLWWALALLLVVGASSLAVRTPGVPVRGLGAEFDSGYYLEIARGGYRDDPHEEGLIGFLPGYSMAIVAVSAVTGLGVHGSAVLVSGAAGLAAAVALWALTGALGLGERARRWTLLVWLAYPFGFFQYGAVYSESLFAALTIGAFLAIERNRRVVAAVLAAAAVIVRPMGLPLVAGLVVLSLERGGALDVVWPAARGWRRLPHVNWSWSAVRPRVLTPILGFVGLLGFFVYCGVRWGRPIVYFESENNLNAPFSLETFSKVHLLSSLRHAPDQPLVALSLLASAAVVVGVIVSAPAVARRFGLGYGMYALGVAGLMWVGQANFASAGRDMMVAVPTMILAGDHLSRRSTRVAGAVIVVAAALTLGNAVAFARGTGYPGW